MTPLAFLQNLSSWEIVLIFLVVLLFFGAIKIVFGILLCSLSILFPFLCDTIQVFFIHI